MPSRWLRLSSALSRPLLLAALTASAAAACTTAGSSKRSQSARPVPRAPGVPLSPPPYLSNHAELDALEADRVATRTMSVDDFEKRYALPFRDGVGYAPLAASGLDRIAAKDGPLAEGERARLVRDGFVVLPRLHKPTFAIGYADTFEKHLPVYISADAILYAMHKSYDVLLSALEERAVVDLQAVLEGMRGALRARGIPGASADVVTDIDELLAVAQGLLDDTPAAPVAGGSARVVNETFARAKAADGIGQLRQFGTTREVDFSQLKPRGHYTASPTLERYFRATMWLSRTDFRFVETLPSGERVLRRRQLEAALALRELVDDASQKAWEKIDGLVQTFVGEADELTLRDLGPLLAELGARDRRGLASVSDAALQSALERTKLGRQRIASQLMRIEPSASTLPLHVSFALLNQRYTADAHVLSSVVYDRVLHDDQPRRLMPDPLDAAFGALANDGAAPLLRVELGRYGYAPELHHIRTLVSAHGDDYWSTNLYTTWTSALRALSPTAASLDDATPNALPSVARTKAWNARILSTQLASWAELRHDTVLYAKQSYSGMPMCEFPDAYVDPYPEVFRRIAEHARLGARFAEARDAAGDSYAGSYALGYFKRLEEAASMLEQMARAELAGTAFTPAQMGFVNRMLTSRPGCGSPVYSGWYHALFLDGDHITQFDPAVADVHTQPSDERGASVGRVLHIGDGFPNEMVVTVKTCHGPRAYVGYVSSFHQVVTSGFERLDDKAWAARVKSAPPAPPAWLAPIVP